MTYIASYLTINGIIALVWLVVLYKILLQPRRVIVNSDGELVYVHYVFFRRRVESIDLLNLSSMTTFATGESATGWPGEEIPPPEESAVVLEDRNKNILTIEKLRYFPHRESLEVSLVSAAVRSSARISGHLANGWLESYQKNN